MIAAGHDLNPTAYGFFFSREGVEKTTRFQIIWWSRTKCLSVRGQTVRILVD